MNRIALAVTLALAAAAHTVSAQQAANEFRDERATVRLLAEQTAIRPGSSLALALDFELAEHWHVYWRNPGDSGEPPSVQWTLPKGFVAGEIEWPIPEKVRTGPILNYAYARHVTFPITVEAPARLAVGERAPLRAKARWLVCRAEECIPGEADLAIELPIANEAPPSDARTTALFAAARARLPRVEDAIIERDPNTGDPTLTLPSIRVEDGARVDFFPNERGAVAPGSARIEKISDGANPGVRVSLKAGELAKPDARRLPGLLIIETEKERIGYALDPSPASGHANGGATAAATAGAEPAPEGSLWLAMLLALAGGAILNLMPCVFPVLSLKVLGFVEQAGSDPRRLRLHGWVFTLGVLASFWVLAGTLLALRGAGESLGWGFQLQSPAFLAALIALLLLLALNLSGVFEIGTSLTSVTGGRGTDARGYRGSFWTGALATVIATPCTAPFMGSALGFALTQPAAAAMLVFTALGFGMALPYLVLSYMPRLLARMPRPGEWMEAFRQLLSFPLYATALWLLYVFSRQTAADSVWGLMTALLLLSMAAWAWGLVQRRVFKSAMFKALVPIFSLAAVALAVTSLKSAGAPESPAEAAEAAHGEFWQPWSPERVAELRAAGHPVFVNFTADWCLSCQVNEKVVFASEPVRRLFSEHDVTALKADWTNEDARIADTLAAFGRDGIPLYVFYPPGGAAPRILPQVPTHGILSEAFAAEVSNRKPTDRSDS